MPTAPENTFQLVALLVFLLPGVVFQFTRSRLRGPSPDDASATNRLLRALTVSTLLAIAYALILRGKLSELVRAVVPVTTGAGGSIIELALWAFGLLFLVPFGLALLDFLIRPRLARFRFSSYDPTPSAWDYAFKDLQPCYLRVLLSDGRYVGGWYGVESFVSSYPEPHELFLERAHRVDADGRLGDEVEGSAGVWIPCEQIVLLEVLNPASAEPESQVDPVADVSELEARGNELPAWLLLAGPFVLLLLRLVRGRRRARTVDPKEVRR